MCLILAGGYENSRVHILTIKRSSEIWMSLKTVHNGFGFKSMSDLISKEIYGRYGTKKLTNEQTERYKMTDKSMIV